jgi:translation initiation factor eIF-2B subunit delta
LEAYLKPQINYLVSCRPISVSMGNAIRFLKCEISAIPPEMPEDDAKAYLDEKIVSFVKTRLQCACEQILTIGLQKIFPGDVILTYGK